MRAKAPSRALREARPDEPAPQQPTREAILDAAERLFSARGLDGVAVRDLAREMGLTPSSLYNHFPGKRALYDAVLERGLRPIVDLVSAAWQPGALAPAQVHATTAALVEHLATHPHLGRLIQRALLEEGDGARTPIGRWVGPLYTEGRAIIGRAAAAAAWEPDEVPHLTLGLFGMVFAYFTNAAAVRGLVGGKDDPFSRRSLAAQLRFLEKAVYRLLGPADRKRRARP